jgi:FAD/FMN-containing dehydrogenase
MQSLRRSRGAARRQYRIVWGSVSDDTRTQLVLSLSRMNRVRELDPRNFTMTVEAGCVLADVQAAAQQNNLIFPLSLAAEGTCQIGGNLATNAGGTAVLRYGNAKRLNRCWPRRWNQAIYWMR